MNAMQARQHDRQARYTLIYEDYEICVNRGIGRIMSDLLDLESNTGRILQDTRHNIAEQLRALPSPLAGEPYGCFIGLGAGPSAYVTRIA